MYVYIYILIIFFEGDHKVALAFSQLPLTRGISEMCYRYGGGPRRVAMHNDKSRSSPARDNTLSQVIRCINIR